MANYHYWAFLIPVLPWLAALWIGGGFLAGSNRGEAGEGKTARVALGAIAAALLGVLGLDWLALNQGLPPAVEYLPWLRSGELRVMISLSLDRPALVMATVVAVVALLTLRFAVDYLHREPGFQRFFAILCLFTGGMELVALGGNAVVTFVGWEAAGISSYLLIAYAYDRTTATRNATRAFVTNRFGDAGFVMGIALAVLLTGGVEWPGIFAAVQQMDKLLAGVMVAGFLVAALAKGGQFPFVAWVGGALEGPTPSSAIFYGALMTHAGAFLVIRLEPLVRHSQLLMVGLIAAGVLTAIYGVVVGMVQTDVKSALICSTQAQLGLIFAECGAGFFEFALWHLVAHLFWRCYQFLGSPSYLHLAEHSPRSAPGWLERRRSFHALVLQRFWVDALADALLTRPTLALAQDVITFDEKVINRIAGTRLTESQLVIQEPWDGSPSGTPAAPSGGVAQGRGLLGRLLERSARWLNWFEEKLILNSGGDGLRRTVDMMGRYLTRIDDLLGTPRYLILLIVVTFTVVL